MIQQLMMLASIFAVLFYLGTVQPHLIIAVLMALLMTAATFLISVPTAFVGAGDLEATIARAAYFTNAVLNYAVCQDIWSAVKRRM